jgi:hypothetical protein
VTNAQRVKHVDGILATISGFATQDPLESAKLTVNFFGQQAECE